MKPIKSSKLKRIAGILWIGLGASLCVTAVWLVLLLISLINGTPIPSSEGLWVNIIITNGHHLVNQMKDVYMTGITGQLLFFKPSVLINLFSGMFIIIEWGSISYVILLMLKIINSIIEGNPFEKLNGRRLRIIAIFFILVPVILQLASYITVKILLKSISMENVELSSNPVHSAIYISLFAGMLLYVLSETLRIGAEIKEENEYTV